MAKAQKTKIWNQEISEYTGKGHPDIIADRIANYVKQIAGTSATEVIINRAGVYLSGETTLSKEDKKVVINHVDQMVNMLIKDYKVNERNVELRKHILLELQNTNLSKEKRKALKIKLKSTPKKLKVPVDMKFIEQDTMLANRKALKLSGDQEIAYFHPLNKNDVHFYLKKIDEEVNTITTTLDYKTLINMKTKMFNLSISKSHIDFEQAKELIIKRAKEYFGEDIKVNLCEFVGGTIFNDTGVTGRKLLVEKEGTGYAHGGGAYYGKDDTKAAVYGYDLLKEKYGKRKQGTFVVVYKPGDKLDKPNYIGKV